MVLQSHYKGMLLALFSSLIFALRLVIIKSTPLEKTETLLFFRFFFDFLILIPFFFKNPQNLKSKKIGQYFARSFLVVISIFCSTYGVKHLALGDAVLLQYTYPLFIALILAAVFKVKVTSLSVTALIIGFSSLFFLLKPQLDFMHLASFASLGSAVAAAILAVSLQRLMTKEPIATILFYCTLIPGMISYIPYAMNMEPVSYSVMLIYLIPSSLLGISYQYLMAKAYYFAPSHVVGSFSYFCVFFSTFLGWLLWDETFETVKIIGGSLIILCSLLMVYENHMNLEKQRMPSSSSN